MTEKLPPGPERVPLLGSLPALSRDPLAFMVDLGRYGDVAYTRIAATKMYSINHPLLIEEVLVGKYRECIKDVGTRELVPLVGNGLLTSDGERWKRQRKLASPPLTPRRIGGYAETMVTCTERELASFRDDEVRNFHEDMMRLTLEIVGKTLLGVDTGRDSERIGHIVEATMNHFDKQFWTWHGLLPPWVVTSERRAFKKAIAELDEIVYRIIRRCREGDSADADHLLARLANARHEDGTMMSDEQLRDEAVTMLLAGHETTALALSYAVYLLSAHPGVALRARAEVDAVLGDRSATLQDMPQLKYVDAIIRETLRLYPPAFAMGREVAQPFELGGYKLPVGAQLMMCPYRVHRDPAYYPDPLAFNPDRWLTPPDPPLPKFAYFPFGGGPRVCIGNHFAMMEAVLVLAAVLQQVELTVVPGYTLEVKPAVTLRPKEGVRVLVRRRRAAPPARRSPWSMRAPAVVPAE